MYAHRIRQSRMTELNVKYYSNDNIMENNRIYIYYIKHLRARALNYQWF